MKISKEQILALKITIILFVLLFLSFGILIYIEYYKNISSEKKNFLNEIKFAKNIKNNLFHIHKMSKNGPGKKIMRNLMKNIYFKNKKTNKEIITGIFEDIKNINDFSKKLDNKKILQKEIFEEKFFVYKIENKKNLIIFSKNIDYIYNFTKQIIIISSVLGFFLLFIIYFISLKLAYLTTKSIRQSNKKLKEYNHNIAHELKTPLSVIKSDLELLEMGKTFDKQLISGTKQEINSMQEIIDSLLFLSEKQDFSDLKQEFFTKINLKSFLENIIDKDFKNYKKNFVLKNFSKKEIFANKELLKILLKNLLKNSLKHGEKSEKIEISFKKNIFEIKNKIKNSKNLDLNKIFDTFYKGDFSRNSGGYGLGLSIVKKIINLHNFKIQAKIKNNFFIIEIIF